MEHILIYFIVTSTVYVRTNVVNDSLLTQKFGQFYEKSCLKISNLTKFMDLKADLVLILTVSKNNT